MNTTTSTYQGSKQQKYYLNNRDVILEKKRAEAAADKVKTDALRIEEQNVRMQKSIKIVNLGKNIYKDIIDEDRFNDHYEIINYLNTVVDEKYKLGRVNYFKILIDYLAFDGTKFNQNHYPWLMISNTFNIKLNSCINKAKKYYSIK